MAHRGFLGGFGRRVRSEEMEMNAEINVSRRKGSFSLPCLQPASKFMVESLGFVVWKEVQGLNPKTLDPKL